MAKKEKDKTTRGLYKFHWDCGRMGQLDGVFVANHKDVVDLTGRNVYFGEVLGKHSEIYGKIEEGEVWMLTNDQDFIEKAEKYGLVPTGFNPLSHIEDTLEDEA